MCQYRDSEQDAEDNAGGKRRHVAICGTETVAGFVGVTLVVESVSMAHFGD